MDWNRDNVSNYILSCVQFRDVMSATMSASFVFTPICFIPGSCFIYVFSDYFLIQLFITILIANDVSCPLAVTRRVPLVAQGTVFPSVALVFSSGFYWGFLRSVISVIVRPVSCLSNVVSVSGLSIFDSGFSNVNVIFMGIQIHILY